MTQWLIIHTLYNPRSALHSSTFQYPLPLVANSHKLNHMSHETCPVPHHSLEKESYIYEEKAEEEDGMYKTGRGSQTRTGKMWHAKEFEFLFKN